MTEEHSEAAATRARPVDTRSGPDKLRSALVRPSRGQAVVGVLLAVLAFAAVTQVRSTGADDTYAGLRQSELIQALNGLQAASLRSESELSDLERTRDSLRSSTQRRATALAQAQQEIATLAILAGTVPAQGPGVRITVTDPGQHFRVNHLLDGIEELRDAGAEAMEINGEVRVVAQTSFEDSEEGIKVDGQLVSLPYQIEAIGDPDDLATALNISGGFNDDVALDQGTSKVTKVDLLHIDATRKASPPRYAEPVKSQ